MRLAIPLRRARAIGLGVALASVLPSACRKERDSEPPMFDAASDEHLIDDPTDDADGADDAPRTAEAPREEADAPQVAALAADRPPKIIYRIELDRALARGPGWLLGQLDPEPVRRDGRFVGWRIGTVFPDAPDLCPPGCDLLPDDVIVAVQGDRLQTPQALSALIERLDALRSLEVARVRDGREERVVYKIVD